MVIKVKKTFIVVICSILIGLFLSNLLFKEYEYDVKLSTVFSSSNKVYFLQQGVYSSFDSMKENMISFSYYIYTYENDKYYTFIGVTKDMENLEKLKGYYKSLDYDIYVKEVNVRNSEYLELLDEYDILLKAVDSKDAIDAIMMQLLGKYEEMIINVG